MADDEASDGPTARDLMQVASYKREAPQAAEKTVDKVPAPKPRAVIPEATDATAKAKAIPVAKVKAEPATKVAAATPAQAKAAAAPKAKPVAETKTKAPAAASKPKDVKARQ